MPFAPGQSGNPLGRPSRKRSLTHLLEERVSKVDLSKIIAEALTCGVYTFPDSNRELPLTTQDLLQLLKFVYRTVDPPANVAARLPAGTRLSSTLPAGASIPIDVFEEMFVAQIELITRYLDKETLQEFMLEWEEAVRPVVPYIEFLPAND